MNTRQHLVVVVMLTHCCLLYCLNALFFLGLVLSRKNYFTFCYFCRN